MLKRVVVLPWPLWGCVACVCVLLCSCFSAVWLYMWGPVCVIITPLPIHIPAGRRRETALDRAHTHTHTARHAGRLAYFNR